METHRKYFFRTIISLFLVFFVVACSPGTEQAQDVIKIGVVGPLTGDASSIGQAAIASAEMAAEEINAAGGVNGKMIELVVEDGHCAAKEASIAGNKLLNVDKVDFILGAMCSPETLAIAPNAEEMERIMVSPCSSSADITNSGDYIFRVYPSDSFSGALGSQYLYEEKGVRKLAILSCLNDFCQAYSKVVNEEFSKLPNTEIVGEEMFEPESRDLRSQITKLQSAEPDALYLIAFTEAAIVGINQIKELGWDIFVLGADPFDDPVIPSKVGSAGDGVQYLLPYSPSAPEFYAKLTENGYEDSTVCSPQAYDIMHIFADMMRKGVDTPQKMKDALYLMEPYEGVSGTIEFDENGDLKGAEYLFKEYQNGERVSLFTYSDGEMTPVE